jgi:Protein of unknown function (DUF2917)
MDAYQGVNDVQVRGEYASVWITQHDDRNDLLLDAGESVRLDSQGLALIATLGDQLAIVVFETLPGTQPFGAPIAGRFWGTWTSPSVRFSHSAMTGLTGT